MEYRLRSKEFKTGIVFATTKIKKNVLQIRNGDLKLLPERNKWPLKYSTL